jgi:hypothetical protein
MATPRPRRKSTLDRRARVALACALLCFVAGQATFRWMLADRPVLGDLEFGRKLDDLRARVAAAPGRPLVVMLGSSRVATGFRPDALPGRDVVAFNFAQVGTGPQMAHLVLHRLLDRGIRPDLVLVEFWPPFWAIDGYLKGYIDSLNLASLDWSSARLLASYLPRPGPLYAKWLPAQIAPIFASRFAILSRLGPSWAPHFDPDRRLANLDASGWWTPRTTISEADRRRLIEHYRPIYGPRLAHFRPRPTPARALLDLLDLARREGIRVAVVVLPEGRDFRAMYPPESLREVDAYLARLARVVPVIDARDWVDDDKFTDGHHLLPAGAEVFTRRLGPLLLGESPALLARPDPGAVAR